MSSNKRLQEFQQAQAQASYVQTGSQPKPHKDRNWVKAKMGEYEMQGQPQRGSFSALQMKSSVNNG